VYVTRPLSPMIAKQLPNSASSAARLRMSRMTGCFVLVALLLLPCCCALAARGQARSPRRKALIYTISHEILGELLSCVFVDLLRHRLRFPPMLCPV
jgi:hypothetical protein